MEKSKVLPYGRQTIERDDIDAVISVLQSDWLTTGPVVNHFEEALAHYVDSKFAVSFCNGTAGLHAAVAAAGVGPGDEVVVSSLSFVATANAVVYCGAKPIFADIDEETLLVDPRSVESKITKNTKAIITVDYAGQPVDYGRFSSIARDSRAVFISDACHALGARYEGKPIGSMADLTVFSFHPVKQITTAEGGMVTTQQESFDAKMRQFRNHGIKKDHRQREAADTWYYEMEDLGFNYRLSDVHSALGISQLAKLSGWLEKRRILAKQYDERLSSFSWIRPLRVDHPRDHAYHLYVIRLADSIGEVGRAKIFEAMRKLGIGVNVHYLPIHLHSFYRSRFNTSKGLCPKAEKAYQHIITLPLFPTMQESDVERVVEALKKSID